MSTPPVTTPVAIIQTGPFVKGSLGIAGVSSQSRLFAGLYIPLYTVPNDGSVANATINYRIGSADVTTDLTVRSAICAAGYVAGDIPSDDEWIQPGGLDLGPNGVNVGLFEDSAVILLPGQTLVVFATNLPPGETGTSTVATAKLHGYVKATS